MLAFQSVGQIMHYTNAVNFHRPHLTIHSVRTMVLKRVLRLTKWLVLSGVCGGGFIFLISTSGWG